MGFWKHILDCLLPPRCLLCGTVLNGEAGLCPECFNKIDFISAPYCPRCGRPYSNAEQGLCGPCLKEKHPLFRMSRSAYRYTDDSKPLILAFKFYDKTENAPVLAQMMYRAGADIFSAGVDVIIPIPLHFSRLIKRRYNQSALLAKYLGRLSGVTVDYTSVLRHRQTRPQVEFSGRARIKNVKDAFRVKRPERIKGKRILLIDDVMTTGSTLRECALALKKAGAVSVDTLTIARVLD